MFLKPLLGVVAVGLLLGGCAGSMQGLIPAGLGNGQAAGEQQAQHVTLTIDPKDIPPNPTRRPAMNAPGTSLASPQPAPGNAPQRGLMGTLASLVPTVSGGPPAVSETAFAEADPTTVYTRVAAQIKSCWLNRANAALPGHKFHAEAKPTGEASITIYRKVEGATLGIATFRIKIEKDGSGASVRSENVKFDDTVKRAMLLDVARWTKGEPGCETRKAYASAPKTATP
jgi:hypothetical protein